ncbi:DUF1559 domain-containing protein [Planctomyces sp. SH-PL62]|uniref:DUF1559 family PulG-like putative transporter n=1 Tax=Planctomyces sp. SH-PL62 TaxID=1636152 RepID=UPI00078CC92C|nr:DUF1559 domain-containing protein [Planctomyces sp. SH-PL62]AMV39275.1 hypothetical protein VT85_17690 [Planctomyces sp. SH-PL62]
MTPRLPEELGGGSTSVLTRGLEWVAVSVEPTPSPMVRVVGQASDAASADALKSLGERAVRLIGSSSRIADFVPRIKLLADELRPRVEGRRIVIDLSGRAGVQWARAVIEPVAETYLRARCVDNLMVLGLAMHNYEATHGTFPPAYSVDANGKPLLSWRVAILPFVDQGDLFKEFHQDEPWDSPHNKTLIERMPQVFTCPSRRGGAPAPGMTVYKTPRETYTLFPGKVGVAIKEITDGTATTIMILETPADQAVVWTRPDDWDVPATIDPKALLTRHIGGASATLGDGSVVFFRQSMNPATLLKLLTRAGGEVVNPGDD